MTSVEQLAARPWFWLLDAVVRWLVGARALRRRFGGRIVGIERGVDFFRNVRILET